MKMAKATEADLEMALTLVEYLDAIERGQMPDALTADAEAIEWIDTADEGQYDRLVDGLKRLLKQGSVSRVIWGMAVVCDPENKCIDPAANTLEIHPDHVLIAQERDRLQERVNVLERRVSTLKSANRLIGARLLVGRTLRKVVAKQPVTGGAA